MPAQVNHRRHWPAGVLALAFLLAIGCTAPTFDDPVTVMTDRQAGFDQRMAAAAQAKRELPDDPHRIAALEQILWERGYPSWQRIDAVNELLAHDEAEFRASLKRRFNLLSDWDTMAHVFDLAVQRGWSDFVPVVVRSYARPAHGVRDEDRLERGALARLRPGQAGAEVIFEVFANADDQMAAQEQVAAWVLLARLTETNRLMAMLAAAPDTTPLVVDLKAASSQLHVLPANREAVLWLGYWRDPSHRAFWDRAAALVATLTPEQREGLQMRHLPALLSLDDAALRRSRTELLARLTSLTGAAERYLEGPTYDGPMRDWPQDFRAWRDKLVWADLVVIDLLYHALREPGVRASLFAQADRDLLDKSTEHGGVLDFQDGAFIVKGYDPAFRQHDLKFIPANAMVEHLYFALAHYHFHAQRHKNRDFAGPGVGDLELADRLNFNFLVLTFIDENRLNVDYYQPGKAVVDLGTIRR